MPGKPTVVKALDHLNLSVANLEASENWYRRVFGFERVEGGEIEGQPWAILKSGEALLCLYEHPERGVPDPEEHGHHGLAHFGLRIVDREAWEATVKREGVKVDYGGAYRWPHSTAWYVEDPTGYTIEVAHWDTDTVRFDPQPAA
jgi:catechol 2,3-dioxygenase-like lactoylglutathione lyase family enzyme